MNGNLASIGLALLLFGLLAGMPPAALAGGPYTDAALGTLTWVAAQQQPDGSFSGLGAGSTADAVLAICAVGGDPNGFLVAGNSPITYIAAHLDDLTASAGSTAKTVLAVVCAGKNPRNLAGVDLLARLEAARDAGGHYGSDLTGHAFALLALAATGQPVPEAAVAWLRNAQTPEGGWGWDGSPTSGNADTNSTALAVQALVAAGLPADDPAIVRALEYLHTQQNEDGGFPYAKPSPWGSDTDANSTAYVIQALVAAGQDPEGAAWTVNGHTPMTALLSLRLPNGAFLWQAAVPGENALATYQAVPAMMLRAFPLTTMEAGPPPALLPETGRAVPPVTLALAGLLLLATGLLFRRSTVRTAR